MFTGIVQQLGKVASVQARDFGAALWVDPCGWAHRPAPGDSIAVNGCCLTVAPESSAVPQPGMPLQPSTIRFEVIRQTLGCTTLGDLRTGDPVNLEHAATPNQLLGGHIVQGHIDCVGLVTKLVRDERECRMRISPSAEPDVNMQCIVKRGSIAVDGVSLTVAATGADWFEVALIPTTLQQTTLGGLHQNSRVNLETDYIAKIVTNCLRRQSSSI